MGSSVTTRRKSWEKVPILGSYLKFRGQNLGYLSLIFLEAKFGAPARISEANFGVKSPDLLIWKYPPDDINLLFGNTKKQIWVCVSLFKSHTSRNKLDSLDRISKANRFLFHCQNGGVSDLRRCLVTHRLHTCDNCPLTITVPVNVKFTKKA